MKHSFEEKLFLSVTWFMVFTTILIVVVSMVESFHPFVGGIVLFGSIVSIGWVGMMAFLSTR